METCGGTLTTTSGAITTPALTPFPAGGVECIWVITTLEVTHGIRLTIRDFSFEAQNYESENYLEVYDGDSTDARSIVRYEEWNYVPWDNEITSSGGALTVRLSFITEPSNVTLDISWNTACGRSFPRGGTIRSPGFPNTYPSQQSCTFPLSYTEGGAYAYTYDRVLTFTHFTLPDSSDTGGCQGDYVEIIESYYSSGTRYCGTELPPVSMGARAVRFVSNQSGGAGLGFEAVFNVTLQCGQTTFTGNDTHISLPSSNPDHIEGRCTYTITVPEGETIILMPTGRSSAGNCVTEYLKVYDGPVISEDQLLAGTCGGESFSKPLSSTSNTMVIDYYTDGKSHSDYGYHVQYITSGSAIDCGDTVFTAPNGTFGLALNTNGYGYYGYHRNGQCAWTVTVAEGQRLYFVFQPFSIGDYSQSYRTQINATTRCYGSDRWPAVSTNNVVLIVLTLAGEGGATEAGLTVQYSSVDANEVVTSCGGTVTGSEGVIASPNYPDYVDGIVDCEWVIQVEPGFSVQLNFSEFDFQQEQDYSCSRVCRRDYFVMSDGYDFMGDLKSYSSETFLKFVSLSPARFSVTWTQVCVKLFSEMSGTVESPNFPGNYPAGLNCSYYFQPTEAGYPLTITFTDFQFEGAASNGSCINDYIREEPMAQYTWNKANELGRRTSRFCGNTLPAEVTMYGLIVNVYLRTDGAHSGAGFKFTFQRNRADCGNPYLTGPEGTVTSPGYPGSFPSNIDCTWTIEVAQGQNITLVSDDMRMRYPFHEAVTGDACVSTSEAGAVLIIYDNSSPVEEDIIGIYCDFGAPPPLTSSGNFLTMEFRSLDNSGQIPARYDWFESRLFGYSTRRENEGWRDVNSASMVIDSITLNNSTDTASSTISDNWETTTELPYMTGSSPDYSDTASELPYMTGSSPDYSDTASDTTSSTITDNWETTREPPYMTDPTPDDWDTTSVAERSQIAIVYYAWDVSSCESSYAKFYDGPVIRDDHLLKTVCGEAASYSRRTLTSTSNSMVIEYYTDGSSDQLYLDVEYYKFASSLDCGSSFLTGHNGMFGLNNSHEYGYYTNFHKNGQCEWTVSAAEGQRLHLDFRYPFLLNSQIMDATDETDYCRSNVKFFDGSVRDENSILGVFCSGHTNNNKWPIISKSSNVLVVLTLAEESGVTEADVTLQFSSFSATDLFTNCGGPVTGSGGAITSPQYPEYIDGTVDCEWVITVDPGFSVRMDITEIHYTSQDPSYDHTDPYSYDYTDPHSYDPLSLYKCTQGSVQIRSGNNISAPLILPPDCGNYTNYPDHYYPHYGDYYMDDGIQTVVSNQNEAFVKFVATTSARFSITWSKVCEQKFTQTGGAVQSPNYPGVYPAGLNCTYIRALIYHWHSFGFLTEQFETSRYCGGEVPDEITIYSRDVTLQFVSDGSSSGSGFRLTYERRLADCGNPYLTGPEGTVTSPGYPGSFPSNINCTWTIEVAQGQNITLVFEDVTLQHPRDIWTGTVEECLNRRDSSQLVIYDNSSAVHENIVGIYCGIEAPPPIVSSSNVLTVEFRSPRNDHFLTGFSAYYVATGEVFVDCGGAVNGTGGVIASPLYPEQYPNNAMCQWVITGDPGDTIRIHFDTFSLQDSDSCSLDSVELRDGSDEFAPRLDRVCGDVIPLDVTSTGNVMFVTFISDIRTSQAGFSATWVSLCEEIHRSFEGTFQSPSYPQSHQGSKECTYIIEQSAWRGYIVQLQFTDFNLGGDTSDCQGNYVEVRDGGYEGAPLLGERFCGNDLPPVLVSTSNMMLVRFVTDGSPSNTGFRATYREQVPTCDTTTLTEKRGAFSSPSHPSNYPNGVECTWEIVAEENNKIQLTFNTFLLEGPSSSCPWDWVKVFDGSDLIGQYCGVLAPDTITSTGNRLTIVFHSDWSVTFEGFTASYVSYDPSSDELTRQYDLYPFGLENGDKRLPRKDAVTRKVKIKTGFPVGEELQYKVFVATKGLISFGKRDKGKKLKLKKKRSEVCPYLSDIRGNSTVGGIYYQLHTDNPVVLSKATAEVREFTDLKNYQASLVLVVTWYRVQHYNSPNPDNEEATIQLALVSNGKRSFAIVYYLAGAMKWSFLQGEPLVIGLTNGNPEGVVMSEYSDTPEAFTSLDTIKGNTGRLGMWIYDVGDSYSADQVCQDWYTRNLALNTERQAGFERLPQCPCSEWFLWGNWRWSHYRAGYDVICFRMTVGRSRSVAPYGKECCYSVDWSDWSTFGQYLSDAPHAGSATAFNPAFWSLRSDYQLEDRQAHDICCYNTTNSDYCRMYYELRPIGECTTRIPFRFSFTWGDPHIKTLDGGEYTFNGYGEYILITMTTASVSFTVQGRTGLAETESGTVTNATVFTAFGAEENGVKVFVGLDPTTNTTMIIYASEVPDTGREKDLTNRFKHEGANFMEENEAYLLTNSNDSLIVTFDISGIQLTISVGYKSLDISVTMPVEFEGQTRGLLGNFNGVKGDDFVLPDGTTLASDLSDRQIYEMFGPAWAVTESNTVLRYPPREGPADYAHPEFTPIFLDEQPADVRQAAENLCGATNLACVYDYVATGSAAFATSTQNTANKADRQETISKNTVPVLTFNNTLVVTVGQISNFNLQGHDPDADDPLTYHVVGDADGGVQLNSATGDVTVNMEASNPRDLSFYAKDSKDVQSPRRDVIIILCSQCSGHGTCDVTDTTPSKLARNVLIAGCTCEPAWAGPDCSQDYDACEESPCSAQQECIDLTPTEQGDSETGFTCSTSCTDGFQVDPDDPTRCADVDECQLPATNCSVTCTNLPGSYQCGCHDGYRLNPDGVTCDDINECADRTAGCQQECFNTDGSYYCGCYSGYSLTVKGCAHGCKTETDSSGSPVATCFCNAGYVTDPNNSSACVDADECQEGLCSQGCTNTQGSFACTCYTGHVLDSDQRTCSPCQGLRYGPECRLTCTCNGRAARCDPVIGCVCTSGWTGSHCEHDVDECAENPDVCERGQNCSNTRGSYVCNCPAGYVKNALGNCEDVDECAEGSTLNTCGSLENCVNVPGGFYCACTDGYTRKTGICTDIDECANENHKCQHVCQNVDGGYNCECHYGYRLDQPRTGCLQVKDVCAEFEGLDCDHGCTLDDNERGVCFCNASYTLAPDLQSCLDEDECALGTAGCSHTCTNTPGGFTCSCPVGKILDNDKKTCIGEKSKIVHLVLGVRAAARNAQCLNFRGGYRCQCQPGYQENQDGSCEDINECAGNVCEQRCENTPGSYRCLCHEGFSFSAITGQCEDVDECALDPTNDCTHRCVNTVGGYRCACYSVDFVLQNDGFTCVASTTCTRTDCPTENGGCSQEQCFCDKGYQLSSDETACHLTATDWCASAISGCAQTCQMTPDGASFTCGCDDGYMLNDDGKTCRGTACFMTFSNSQCVNSVGSFLCPCDVGYFKTPEGTCADIDWCAISGCDQLCQETPDGTSFTCGCTQGYVLGGDGKTCTECPEGTYGADCSTTCTCNSQNTVSCDKATGSCSCDAGWEGFTCDDDIDECTPPTSVTCPQYSRCVNSAGGYECSCDAGYYMTSEDICAVCLDNFYGVNCAQVCGCNAATSTSCDRVNGACACEAGWTGARCETDINECTTGTHDCNGDRVVCVNTPGSYGCGCVHGYTYLENRTCVDVDECRSSSTNDCAQICKNTDGGYTCSCNPGFVANGNDCRELTRVQMTVTIGIPVAEGDLSDPDSQTYQDWVVLVTQALYDKLKPKVDGLRLVIVHALRVGSIVADAEPVVDEVSDPDAVPSLSSALMTLTQDQMTLGNETGYVTINVNGVAVETSEAACEVYEAIRPCQTGQRCQVTDGLPTCSTIEEEDDDMALIIALVVSISVGLLLVGGITLTICLCKKSKKTAGLITCKVQQSTTGMFTKTSLLSAQFSSTVSNKYTALRTVFRV
ncbi:hypothetical protein BaRGS_00022912 [Batillaria attramentaria]|uniref:Cubilin n=1 Tax=Batillaria attramentaria TaxID=370345 RepID=A0ABD0KG03_9CAEN